MSHNFVEVIDSYFALSFILNSEQTAGITCNSMILTLLEKLQRKKQSRNLFYCGMNMLLRDLYELKTKFNVLLDCGAFFYSESLSLIRWRLSVKQSILSGLSLDETWLNWMMQYISSLIKTGRAHPAIPPKLCWEQYTKSSKARLLRKF